MSEPARRTARARLSRRGMTLGVAMMLGGAILRFGAVPIGLGAGAGDPAASPTADPVSGASPVATEGSPTGPPDVAELWFGDDFTTEAAWPVGDLGLVVATVAAGRYVVDTEPVDLPVTIVAAAGDRAPDASRSVAIQVGVAFASGDPATSAGPILEDVTGARLMVLLSADGRVGLYRDSIESFDLLASAAIAPPSGVVTVGLLLDGEAATVLLDGAAVTSAVTSLVPVAVGLAVWSPFAPARVAFEAYRVWSSPPD